MMDEEPTGKTFSGERTAGRLCLDTCVLIGRSDPDNFKPDELPALDELLELYKNRRVMLAKTDTVDLERIDGQSQPVAQARLIETMDLLEVNGPFLLGHGRLDHNVLAAPDDDARIDRILALVHPNAVRTAPQSKNDLRDALHLATAIRYGYDGFVTIDRGVLRAARAIRVESATFSIFTPTEAVDWVRRKIASLDRRVPRQDRPTAKP